MEPHPADHPLSAGEGPSTLAREAARRALYVHVPFCARRCDYCDFSSGTLSAAAVERYLGALEREAILRAPLARDTHFSSVFFGGGTPSALSARHFARVWSILQVHFTLAPDAEVTLEANPESVRPALLEAWAAAGVNRLSMGAQSFDPDELRGLGRIHDRERPGQAYELARRHGFRRLSLDLMFGFPGHTAATWTDTLEAALALEPEHLSAYCFIPEVETPLGGAVLRGEAALPSSDEQAGAYETLTRRLEADGYHLYETSNFSRLGGECHHNLVYWLRRDYLGLGPSAHGLWNGVRTANAYALEAWAEALENDRSPSRDEPETISSRDEEIVMLGLRLGTGLRRQDYDSEVWSSIQRRYGEAFRHGAQQGRIEPTANGWRIPARHRFVADDVIAWLTSAAERRRHVDAGRHLTLSEAHP